MHSKLCCCFAFIAVLFTLAFATVSLYLEQSPTTVLPQHGKPCALRKYPAGYVCVCNATYCDTFEEDSVTLRDPDQLILITSSAVSDEFVI